MLLVSPAAKGGSGLTCRSRKTNRVKSRTCDSSDLPCASPARVVPSLHPLGEPKPRDARLGSFHVSLPSRSHHAVSWLGSALWTIFWFSCNAEAMTILSETKFASPQKASHPAEQFTWCVCVCLWNSRIPRIKTGFPLCSYPRMPFNCQSGSTAISMPSLSESHRHCPS